MLRLFIPEEEILYLSQAYYTILGVAPDKTRELLAVVNFPTESASGWKEVLKELKKRGVKKIDLFVTDGLCAVEDSISSFFSSTQVQLCTVHLQRNILKNVKPKDKLEIASDIKEVFYPNSREDNIEKAWNRWVLFINKHRKKYPKFSNYLGIRYRRYFTYFKYDYRITSMIYTTNWIERLNIDYKRTTKIRGALT